MKISEAATKEAGQEYTFLTFDLPVVKKAYYVAKPWKI